MTISLLKREIRISVNTVAGLHLADPLLRYTGGPRSPVMNTDTPALLQVTLNLAADYY